MRPAASLSAQDVKANLGERLRAGRLERHRDDTGQRRWRGGVPPHSLARQKHTGTGRGRCGWPRSRFPCPHKML
ncbi:hypothetical protein BV133_2471 [Blastochloris viridis]|uniref:Uncharacterized protein n=1 Tax=Blastochloris viridis TaxID=1079 RepID=A0A182D3R5_BLAVI|nr:hypothetical protein BV133_2471 [Blastochloris viridis]